MTEKKFLSPFPFWRFSFLWLLHNVFFPVRLCQVGKLISKVKFPMAHIKSKVIVGWTALEKDFSCYTEIISFLFLRASFLLLIYYTQLWVFRSGFTSLRPMCETSGGVLRVQHMYTPTLKPTLNATLKNRLNSSSSGAEDIASGEPWFQKFRFIYFFLLLIRICESKWKWSTSEFDYPSVAPAELLKDCG